MVSPGATTPPEEGEVVLMGYDISGGDILPEPLETQDKILRWLKPTCYAAENGEYRRHLSSYLRGTGKWLFSSPVYREWHDGLEQGILWLRGIPGSGKSVMAANVVNTLSTEKVPVLYFFFRQIIDANHKPRALLQDWLAQLLPFSVPLQISLKDLSKMSMESVPESSLWDSLRAALMQIPKVYCVVDALDEMDSGNDAFLQSLVELGQWRPAHVKLVVTSRPVASVELPLRHGSLPQIRLEERLVDQDIGSYVLHRLKLSITDISSQDCDLIKEAVPGRANGLFLYAKLAMDAFMEDGADAKEVLRTLPTDLNVMYSDLLREHARRSGISQDLQLLILSFVTHASRPLRLIELAEVIKTVENDNIPGLDNLKAIKSLLRLACGPLLEILPDETICVVHHSLTEFLNGSTRKDPVVADVEYPILDLNSTHNRLASACLSYLSLGILGQVKLVSKDDYVYDSEDDYPIYREPAVNVGLRLDHSFLNYSLDNWYVHARKAEQSGILSKDAVSGMDQILSPNNFEALKTLCSLAGPPIHVVSGFGLSQYVAKLIEDGVNVNLVDSRGRTPIFPAASRGHANIVEHLLRKGAIPDQHDTDEGEVALHFAARGNHAEVAKLLLEAGADPMTPKTLPMKGMMEGDPYKHVGEQPLMHAARYRSTESLREFLPFLKDPQTVNRALGWAAGAFQSSWDEYERPVAVDVILEHPLVDVNAKIRGETPLCVAARKFNLREMISLLKAGANPNIQCKAEGKENGNPNHHHQKYAARVEQTALHALARKASNEVINAILNHEPCEYPQLLQDCLSLLLSAGAKINQRDSKGFTALYHASEAWPAFVRSLLEAGADSNLVQGEGDTVLHHCVGPDVIRVLVEEGKANINLQRPLDGKTPISAAKRNLTPELVNCYVELGADLGLQDYDGRTALHDTDLNASSAEAILATGFPPDIKDAAGNTPLHVLEGLSSFDYPMTLLLVSAGADLNARDNLGRTALYKILGRVRSYSNNDRANLDELIAKGANLGAVDYRGRSMLFACAGDSSNSMVKDMVNRGLDPNIRDNLGNSLLHHMLRGTKTSGASWLKEMPLLGVSLDQTNLCGQSALHFIVAPNRECELSHLRIFKEPDFRDNAGIRPLHIAAIHSEKLVHELLTAGASPGEPSMDGMTPLHVAVRFCQPGIVRMLLDAIRTRRGKVGLRDYLNTPYGLQTPAALQLACRSGLAETVRLLLAAGADPNGIGHQEPPGLSGCVLMEQEEALWEHKSQQGMESISSAEGKTSNPTRGVKFLDTVRRFSAPHSTGSDDIAFGSGRRLEEILELLHAYGADMVIKTTDGTNLDQALARCRPSDNYTIECLAKFRSKLDKDHTKTSFSTSKIFIKEDSLHPAEWLLAEIQPLDSCKTMIATSLYRRGAAREAFIRVDERKVLSEDRSLLDYTEAYIFRMNIKGQRRSDKSKLKKSEEQIRTEIMLVKYLETSVKTLISQRNWETIKFDLHSINNDIVHNFSGFRWCWCQHGTFLVYAVCRKQQGLDMPGVARLIIQPELQGS